ncbi:MAG: hypothetical protein Q8N96_08775 [Methylovulum sp.]|nr:hypothetical protein [Methylovulum sp.]
MNLIYASSGQVVTVSLTGLPIAQDGLLYSTASFNAVFGSDSVI